MSLYALTADMAVSPRSLARAATRLCYRCLTGLMVCPRVSHFSGEKLEYNALAETHDS
jgi:hypothetical protein